MKRIYALLLAGLLLAPAGCKDFLDVNTNPNGPETVSANLYLPSMLHWMATSPQYDGRYIGRYTQQWMGPGSAISLWDRMGYSAGSDAAAEQWRMTYWLFGQNLIDMMDKARNEERWDILGVGQVLKAFGWQAVTDMHGPIIIKEAFDQTRTVFDYDTQEYAYFEVDSLLHEAIANLQRTDGAVDQAYLAVGDHIYNGDRTKWLKFAYGLLALNRSHFTNKQSLYKADSVIALVDQSFESNADDALFPYPALTSNDDKNFYGTSRNNVTGFRQTEFIVHLMDGTEFGGTVDPRMSRMLAPAPDGQYRGLNINEPDWGGLPDDQKPMNFFGYTSLPGAGQPSRYIFSDKSHFPIMTYAQLQFVKAEAQYRKGDKPGALETYKNAIAAHIDFVNARNSDDGQSPTPISTAEKDAFLSDPNIVPTDPNDLTLSHIMSQKYIAQWAWGHNELWMDMRRYHYTDTESGIEVFRGFALPENLFVDNNGKPVERARPRYNSEYVWNQAGLEAIGGLDPDYHTKELWITQPGS